MLKLDTIYTGFDAPNDNVIFDVDGDGFDDLVNVDSDVGVVILHGDGAGGFGLTTYQFPPTGSVAGPEVADIDQDGDLDLVYGDPSDHFIRIAVNDGSGLFTGATFSQAFPVGLILADVNGDGDPDLISTTSTADQLHVYLGQSGASFGTAATLLVGDYPTHVSAGDFTGDGLVDLAVTSLVTRSVELLAGDGQGGFSPIGAVTDLTPGNQALVDTTLADVDNDGRLDLVVAATDYTAVALGQAGGGFGTATAFAAPDATPGSFVVTDFDGDGHLDIIRAGFTGIRVQLGDGSGAFTDAGVFGAARYDHVTAHDVNGDGRPDVIASAPDYEVAVLLNAGLTITAATPSQAEGRAYTFTVERYGDLADGFTVDWDAAGSGASPADADDFTGPASGTLTFAPGQATASLTVTVAGDRAIEADETFAVTLSGATDGWSTAGVSATALIANDDSPSPPPPPTAGGGGDDLAVLNDLPTSYSAGAGQDFVMADGGDDTVHGNTGEDTLYGGAGDDIVHGGQGSDAVYGDDGVDILSGDKGDDFVHGGRGDDVIDGGEGADILAGGQGNDVLRGGDGGDVLSGDRGDDTLSGGAGDDLFRIAADGGADVIVDFSAGDRLQVAGPYSVSQAGADILVTLGGGDSVTLQNIQLDALPAGWIFA